MLALRTYPVVQLDDLFALLHGHEALVLCKELHRLLNTGQQLPGPHDVASSGWHIVRYRRVVLLCLILCLHGLKVASIVLENDLQGMKEQ